MWLFLCSEVNFQQIMFSETRPLKRASSLVLGGARGPATCYFCSLITPLGKAVVVDREASKGGSSSCNLKTHPPSTIGSGARKRNHAYTERTEHTRGDEHRHPPGETGGGDTGSGSADVRAEHRCSDRRARDPQVAAPRDHS